MHACWHAALLGSMLCPAPCSLRMGHAYELCWAIAQVAEAVLAAYDSGELARVLGEEEGFKGWVKALGKGQKRKGKRLFMPLRLALTGSTHVRLLLLPCIAPASAHTPWPCCCHPWRSNVLAYIS